MHPAGQPRPQGGQALQAAALAPASRATKPVLSTNRRSTDPDFSTNCCRPAAHSLRRTVLAAALSSAASGCGPPPLAAPLPPVVNWHLEARCNYGCKFCFATFEDVKQQLREQRQQGARCSGSSRGPTAGLLTDAQLLAVPRLLAEQGVSRLNFVGGEPLLHPLIHELIAAAKEADLVTSMVTNASLLDAAGLLRLAGKLDWLAVSVDASSDELHAAVGRGLKREVASGLSSHLAHVREVWGLAQGAGFRMKLNTVVTRATLKDNMAPLVAELRPERWKVFQVLPIEGQNDGSVEALLITGEEFEAWVERHRAALAQAARERAGGLCEQVVPLVAESNQEMQGSYAMLDAACRFFSNASGAHAYGPSIFSAQRPTGDVAAAWAGVSTGFSAEKFGARGGVYDWGQGTASLGQHRARWNGGQAEDRR